MDMAIEDIRRENARYLASTVETRVVFGSMVGMDNSQVSQIIGKNPTKNIGNSIARRIEVAFNKERGWIDVEHPQEATQLAPGRRSTDTDMNLSNVIALHPDDPLPDDMVSIPESRIEFSAGNGRTAHYELVEDQEPATYRLSWFQKYGMNPTKVRRFRVSGNSMEPQIFAGNTILVNTDETNIVDGKTYAIRYGDELRVKKMYRRLDGTIILRSLNPEYKDEEIAPELAEEHIAVIGRVRESSGTGGY
jgi:phage repressor protein C with HTH and peptisase S24 domain